MRKRLTKKHSFKSRLHSTQSGRFDGTSSKIKKPVLTGFFVFFLVGLVSLSYFFLKDKQTASFSQVYLFLEHQSEGFKPKAVLIRSAVENKNDQLIYLDQTKTYNFIKDQDLEVIKTDMSSNLQVPIDQLIIFDDLSDGGKIQLVRNLLTTPNLAFFTKLNLFKLLVFSDTLHLNKENVSDLSESFLERSLMQTGKICSVAVINTTEINGLASKLSQFLEQNGVYVTRASSNDQNLKKSHILVDKDRKDCLPLAKKLEAILPHEQEMTVDKALPYYRANVVVFLGSDLDKTSWGGE